MIVEAGVSGDPGQRLAPQAAPNCLLQRGGVASSEVDELLRFGVGGDEARARQRRSESVDGL